MKPYFTTVQYAAEMAPDLGKPTEFIKWAEDIASIISYAYNRDYDQVTEDLVEKVKEDQDYLDENE